MGIDQVAEHTPLLLSPPASKPPVPRPAHVAQGTGRNDIEAISVWLAEYRERRNTFTAYRHQARRLIDWMGRHGLTLAAMDRPAWMLFERDLATTLSGSSVTHAINILSGMLDYMVGIGHLPANPLHMRRKARRQRETRVHRYLDDPAWTAVKRHMASIRQDGDPEYERTRFILTWMVLMGPRASEMVGAMMGDIHAIRRNGATQWWWRVLGKGDSEASVPVAEEAMDALIRYRVHLGRPAFPPAHDHSPLVQRPGGSDKPISRTTLHRIIKSALSGAAAQSDSDDTKALLHAASTHWLRHTAASQAVDAGIDLVDVARLLRHKRIETTMRYVHRDDDRLHAALEKRKI